MSDTKLLPCPNPWCRSALDPFVASMSLLGTPVFRAECGSCGINCGELTRTEEDAAATWNTRVPDPRLDAAQSLADALTYPRFGDTAQLFEKCVEMLRQRDEKLRELTGENWTSLYLHHFSNAITTMRAALAAWEKLK